MQLKREPTAIDPFIDGTDKEEAIRCGTLVP
jgi:hypothetical protein